MPDPDRSAPAPGRDLYNRSNAFFRATDLMPLALEECPDLLERLIAAYDELSGTYQASKNADGTASGNIALA